LTCRPRRRAARARPERPTGHTSRAQPAAAAMSHTTHKSQLTSDTSGAHSRGHGARRRSLRATDNFDSVTTGAVRDGDYIHGLSDRYDNVYYINGGASIYIVHRICMFIS